MQEIPNKHNEQLLRRYEMICKNKGLTSASIDAIIKVDLPLFLNFIGNKNVEDVTHIDIENFFDYCINERHNGEASLNRKYASINRFYETMIKKEYIQCKNPMDKVDKIKMRKRVRGYLTIEEIRQIFDYIDKIGDLRAGAIFSLFFSSGIRLSELYRLNRDSLDFEHCRFKVLGKGQKERVCIFSEDTKDRILKYLETRKDDNPALFISREGNRLSKKAIQNLVKRIAKEAGTKKNVFPHLLRHSLAMWLLKNNIPLDRIQLVLGHSNISTTQVYAYSNIDDIQAMLKDANLLNIDK